MTSQSFRLPRLVESDPRGAALLESLIAHTEPIRTGSELSVPVARFDGIEEILRNAHRAGRVVRGLETAERTLASEAHGLRLVDESSGVKRGVRVSRLLLLAADGSNGFYRQVENLLKNHGARSISATPIPRSNTKPSGSPTLSRSGGCARNPKHLLISTQRGPRFRRLRICAVANCRSGGT